MSNNKQSMKEILLAGLLIGMISSCTESTVEKKTTNIIPYQGGNPMSLVIIEGCEYLQYAAGHKYSLCHKGNCKNPIHKGGNK